MENRLREALTSGRFAITVEVVPPGRDRTLDEGLVPALALAGSLAGDARVAGISVTDRVRSDDDHRWLLHPALSPEQIGQVK